MVVLVVGFFILSRSILFGKIYEFISVVYVYPALAPIQTTTPAVGFICIIDGVFYQEIYPSAEHAKYEDELGETMYYAAFESDRFFLL